MSQQGVRDCCTFTVTSWSDALVPEPMFLPPDACSLFPAYHIARPAAAPEAQAH